MPSINILIDELRVHSLSINSSHGANQAWSQNNPAFVSWGARGGVRVVGRACRGAVRRREWRGKVTGAGSGLRAAPYRPATPPTQLYPNAVTAVVLTAKVCWIANGIGDSVGLRLLWKQNKGVNTHAVRKNSISKFLLAHIWWIIA